MTTRTAQPPEHNFSLKREEWESVVFDAATLFTVIEVNGRAGRTRAEFLAFPDAIAYAADRHACVYAVTASGRSIVLDRADWPRWATRYNLNRAELENQAMTTTQTTDQTNAFLITWGTKGPSECAVLRFPTRAAAETYSFEELDNSATAFVIETELDFSDRLIFSGPVLVTIFNRIADGCGVRRFESLAYARERVFSEIVRRFGSVPYTVPTPAPEPEAVPVAPTKEKTVMAKAKTTGTLGRKPNVSKDAMITVLAPKNPKREGTNAFDRFALYRSGMKVSTFLEKGGSRIDLAYDTAKEYIRIDEPAMATA